MFKFFSKRYLEWVVIFILGVFLVMYFNFLVSSKEKKEQEQKISEEKKFLIEKKESQKKKADDTKKIFQNKDIKAQSFLVLDLDNSKEIFSKNKNKKFGIASLTKIAAADVFIESNTKKNIEVLQKNLLNEGTENIWPEEFFTPENLLVFMMIVSSNDMASVLTNELGEKKFIKKMNELAENLELKSTLFFSESGIDYSKDVAGGYSSVKDIATLVKYFYEKNTKLSEKFSVPKKRICSDFKCYNAKNTNKLFFEKFPHKILFSKTGYTKKVGGSLTMILEISGKKYLVVVLSSGKEERFNDGRLIAEAISEIR